MQIPDAAELAGPLLCMCFQAMVIAPLHFQKIMDHTGPTGIGTRCRESAQACAKLVDVALVESHGFFDQLLKDFRRLAISVRML